MEFNQGLKNRFPCHPDGGQDRELTKITVFFPLLAMTPGKVNSSSTACMGYYSDVVGKIFNIAGIFFPGERLPDRDYRSGRVQAGIPMQDTDLYKPILGLIKS